MKKLFKLFIGILLVICSGALTFIGMNNNLLGINSELVLEKQYLFGVIACDPYTIKRFILLFALISLIAGITLISLTIVNIYHKKKSF